MSTPPNDQGRKSSHPSQTPSNASTMIDPKTGKKIKKKPPIRPSQETPEVVTPEPDAPQMPIEELMEPGEPQQQDPEPEQAAAAVAAEAVDETMAAAGPEGQARLSAKSAKSSHSKGGASVKSAKSIQSKAIASVKSVPAPEEEEARTSVKKSAAMAEEDARTSVKKSAIPEEQARTSMKQSATPSAAAEEARGSVKTSTASAAPGEEARGSVKASTASAAPGEEARGSMKASTASAAPGEEARYSMKTSTALGEDTRTSVKNSVMPEEEVRASMKKSATPSAAAAEEAAARSSVKNSIMAEEGVRSSVKKSALPEGSSMKSFAATLGEGEEGEARGSVKKSAAGAAPDEDVRVSVKSIQPAAPIETRSLASQANLAPSAPAASQCSHLSLFDFLTSTKSIKDFLVETDNEGDKIGCSSEPEGCDAPPTPPDPDSSTIGSALQGLTGLATYLVTVDDLGPYRPYEDMRDYFTLKPTTSDGHQFKNVKLKEMVSRKKYALDENGHPLDDGASTAAAAAAGPPGAPRASGGPGRQSEQNSAEDGAPETADVEDGAETAGPSRPSAGAGPEAESPAAPAEGTTEQQEWYDAEGTEHQHPEGVSWNRVVEASGWEDLSGGSGTDGEDELEAVGAGTQECGPQAHGRSSRRSRGPSTAAGRSSKQPKGSRVSRVPQRISQKEGGRDSTKTQRGSGSEPPKFNEPVLEQPSEQVIKASIAAVTIEPSNTSVLTETGSHVELSTGQAFLGKPTDGTESVFANVPEDVGEEGQRKESGQSKVSKASTQNPAAAVQQHTYESESENSLAWKEPELGRPPEPSTMTVNELNLARMKEAEEVGVAELKEAEESGKKSTAVEGARESANASPPPPADAVARESEAPTKEEIDWVEYYKNKETAALQAADGEAGEKEKLAEYFQELNTTPTPDGQRESQAKAKPSAAAAEVEAKTSKTSKASKVSKKKSSRLSQLEPPAPPKPSTRVELGLPLQEHESIPSFVLRDEPSPIKTSTAEAPAAQKELAAKAEETTAPRESAKASEEQPAGPSGRGPSNATEPGAEGAEPDESQQSFTPSTASKPPAQRKKKPRSKIPKSTSRSSRNPTPDP